MNACSDHTADRQGLAVGKVDFGESRVCGHQLCFAILLVKILHCEIVVHLGYDHLAMAGTQCSVYHQDIAVLDARALHRTASGAPHEGGQRVCDEELVQVMAFDSKIVRRRGETSGDETVYKSKGYR